MDESVIEISEPAENPGLETPQFDEEATLQSAKPVIPLKVVTAERKRWRLLFGASVLVAILAGAAGAILIYSQRSAARTTETRATQPGSTTSTIITEGIAENVGQSAENPDESPAMPESEAKAESPGLVSPIRAKPRSLGDTESQQNEAVSVREETRARRVHDESELDRQSPEELREARRAARREARREQRAAQRRDRENSDLFRIQDIFEGAPTP